MTLLRNVREGGEFGRGCLLFRFGATRVGGTFSSAGSYSSPDDFDSGGVDAGVLFLSGSEEKSNRTESESGDVEFEESGSGVVGSACVLKACQAVCFDHRPSVSRRAGEGGTAGLPEGRRHQLCCSFLRPHHLPTESPSLSGHQMIGSLGPPRSGRSYRNRRSGCALAWFWPRSRSRSPERSCWALPGQL